MTDLSQRSRTLAITLAAASVLAIIAAIAWSVWPAPAASTSDSAQEVAFETFSDEAASEVAPEAQPPEDTVAEDPVAPVAEARSEEELELEVEEFSQTWLPGQEGDESAKPEKPEKKPKKSKKKRKKSKLKPAILVIVTNFDKADVTVNGRAYPEYYEDPDDQGMVLPAGGPYDIQVTFDGKTKNYTIGLRPYEKRIMVVELTGFKAGNAAPPPKAAPTPRPPPKPPTPKVEEKKEEDDKQGRVTVYSKPRGDIMIDGQSKGKMTPNTVDTEPGRHEVQVKYEDGEVSEKKIVRVREGSRIKLFFRQRK